MLSGSCLCRAIRYEVSVPITELRACHCKDCQKSSGTGGSVNAMIASSGLRITHGTPKRLTVTAHSGRTLHRFFCGDCGSPLFSRRELTPETTKSARPWAYIDPESRQFAGQPDAPTVKK
jgi:hypothetical protein